MTLSESIRFVVSDWRQCSVDDEDDSDLNSDDNDDNDDFSSDLDSDNACTFGDDAHSDKYTWTVTKTVFWTVALTVIHRYFCGQ